MSGINSISSATSYWQSIKNGWESGVDEITEDAEAVGEVISTAYNAVEDAVSSVGDAIGDGATAVKEAWETLGNTIDTYM